MPSVTRHDWSEVLVPGMRGRREVGEAEQADVLEVLRGKRAVTSSRPGIYTIHRSLRSVSHT